MDEAKKEARKTKKLEASVARDKKQSGLKGSTGTGTGSSSGTGSGLGTTGAASTPGSLSSYSYSYSGGLSDETISPTNWRKVQQDFTEVMPKSNTKKQREMKEKDKEKEKINDKNYDNKRNMALNNNNFSRNNMDNGNRKGQSQKPQSNRRQVDEADLWDMPTGLSSEESQGLSEREMFELERKKFLAMRHQPAAGGIGVGGSTSSKEGSYHTESDAVMDTMKNEQTRAEDSSGHEVSGSSFDFQLKQPLGGGGDGRSGSGIRSLTASDVMKGMHGNSSGGSSRNGVGATASSSEDMAWFGAMLSGSSSSSSGSLVDMGDVTIGKGRTQSSDQDFFSHFLSDPVMTTPLTPPVRANDGPLAPTPSSSDAVPFSLLESGQGSGSSSKSSRLGSLLGIPLTPPTKAKQPSSTSEFSNGSGIKELCLSSELVGGISGGGENMGQSIPITGASNISQNAGHPMATNQKSRDLLATLGFSPPRNTPHHFQSPAFSPAVVEANVVNNHGATNNNDGRGRFVFQEPDGPSPPLPSPPVTTPSKTIPAAGVSPAPTSSSKRSAMSASSRLQLARMKQQQGGGGTKKKIDVSSLFNKAPTSKGSASITVSTTVPISNASQSPIANPPVSSTATNTATPDPPHPVASDKPPQTKRITTNNKGASLLMKLKK